MALGKTHEIHARRAGRNIGVALALVAFAAVVFGLSVAKITVQGPVEAFDHTPRPVLADRAGD